MAGGAAAPPLRLPLPADAGIGVGRRDLRVAPAARTGGTTGWAATVSTSTITIVMSTAATAICTSTEPATISTAAAPVVPPFYWGHLNISDWSVVSNWSVDLRQIHLSLQPGETLPSDVALAGGQAVEV